MTFPLSPLRDPTQPITLENGQLRLSIEPRFGRVLDFRRLTENAENLLWVLDPQLGIIAPPPTQPDEWLDRGGDKIWASQRAGWPLVMGRGWPPFWPGSETRPATASSKSTIAATDRRDRRRN